MKPKSLSLSPITRKLCGYFSFHTSKDHQLPRPLPNKKRYTQKHIVILNTNNDGKIRAQVAHGYSTRF